MVLYLIVLLHLLVKMNQAMFGDLCLNVSSQLLLLKSIYKQEKSEPLRKLAKLQVLQRKELMDD